MQLVLPKTRLISWVVGALLIAALMLKHSPTQTFTNSNIHQLKHSPTNVQTANYLALAAFG
jgi:hypothetical protein